MCVFFFSLFSILYALCFLLLWIHFVIESMSTTMAQNVMPNWATSFYELFAIVADVVVTVVAICIVAVVVVVLTVFV